MLNIPERTIAVFEHKRADRLVWQPRLHHWYEVNRARWTLPPEYAAMNILEIYDDLGASPRGYHFYDDTLKTIEGEKIRLVMKEDENAFYTKYVTPTGSLTQVEKKNIYGTNRMRVEYFLKDVSDFEVLSYILKNQDFFFDRDLYDRTQQSLGNRCEPSINVRWGSIQRLLISYMGLERGTIALWRHTAEVEGLLQVFEENDDKLFDVVKQTPFRVVNFLDNIDEGLVSPTLFKKYMIPYYQKRTSQLHRVNKFCTSHWDGKIRNVLPFAKETGLDGLECVPPMPQGNVTLEELKDGLGNMTLCDGIPATHFLREVTSEELKGFVYRLLELFSPNLIVGISDMMPPDGQIDKVRMVGGIVADCRT